MNNKIQEESSLSGQMTPMRRHSHENAVPEAFDSLQSTDLLNSYKCITEPTTCHCHCICHCVPLPCPWDVLQQEFITLSPQVSGQGWHSYAFSWQPLRIWSINFIEPVWLSGIDHRTGTPRSHLELAVTRKMWLGPGAASITPDETNLGWGDFWGKPQAKTVQGELTETTPVRLLRALEQAREQTGCTGRGRDRSAGRLEEELREQPRQPSDSSELRVQTCC